MNAAHCRELSANPGAQRSKCRDALTLFDECGVIIISPNRERLEQLARHDWGPVFQNTAEWETQHAVFVTGHALLEKYLQPYKAITAQALLILDDGRSKVRDRNAIMAHVDGHVAAAIDSGGVLKTTHSLSALPLAGIPGWWQAGEVNRDFYADAEVFRPLGTRRPAAPVYAMEMSGLTSPVG